MIGKIVGSKYFLDGKEVTRAEFDRAVPDLAGAPPIARKRGVRQAVRPKASDALAVHPAQVREAEESARRRGVPTRFLPDGRPVITSRAHQKRYLKAYGFHNKDGGYGD